LELRGLARQSKDVIVLAGVVGIATGLGVAGFEAAVVEGLDALATAPLWMIAIMPGVGLAVAAVVLRTLGGGCSTATTDEYLRAFHEEHHVLEPRPLVSRIVASIATLASGVPMGLEGPSLYLGAGLGDTLTRRFPRVFSVRNRRTLLVAGAAAGVAAIFKAPATGAVFALEVPYQNDLARRMLGPALVASATSYLTFVALHGTTPLLEVSGTPPFSFRDLAGAALLGVICGAGARVFASMLLRAKAVSERVAPWIRVPVAAALLVAIFVLARALTGENVTTGPGYTTVQWALEPSRGVWLLAAVLVLRCAATTVAVAGGGVGGLFIPVVIAGALAGRMLGGAVHALDTSLFTVIGAAAFLGAGYRVPLAAVVFVAEATGRPGFIVPGLLAAVVAELMMGRSAVTKYQQVADADIEGGD
jgi:CIC family chloride channel protein